MRYVIAFLVLLPPVLLAVGAIRGRVTVRPCCEPAERDLRMAPAYAAEADADVEGAATASVRAGHEPG